MTNRIETDAAPGPSLGSICIFIFNTYCNTTEIDLNLHWFIFLLIIQMI